LNTKMTTLSLALTLLFLLGLFGAGPFLSGVDGGRADVAYAAKIDTQVWKDLAGGGPVTVMALMAEQADLSAAAEIDDWDTRGWAVYNALTATAARTQAGVLAELTGLESAGHVSQVRSFWIVNLIMLRTDETGLWALAARPEIAAVLPDAKLEAPVVIPDAEPDDSQAVEWGVAKIRAPEVWSTYGVTGAGAVAANVDTGVQYNHPALVNQYRGNLGGGSFDHNYNWFDPTFTWVVPTDTNGHGTHTMGTEVGDDGGTNQIGVAPGADWMAAFGCCPSNEALLEAQQFMVAPTDLAGNNPNPSLRPDVLNQSWGGPGGSQIFEGVIASLRASGIFPTFSAGNSGSGAADGCGRLGSPGDNPSAFNVGATNSSDVIATFSSRGPNPFTGDTGPNVSAPGVSVRSSVPTNNYATYNGTSMASPHVAGAVALLISLEPELRGQVEQLEELLRKTAVPLTSSQTCGGVPGSEVPNNVYGWGRIDVKAAADMVYQAGTIEGTVTAGGNPVVGATITYSRLGYTLTTTTDGSGQYEVVAGAGSWSMTAAAYGYETAGAPAVVVTQGNTTIQDFSLTALAVHNLSGLVSDTVSFAGIPATISVVGEAVSPVMAGLDGSYTLPLAEGSHTIRFEHPGFVPVEQVVNITANQTVDQALTPHVNYACFDNTGGYPLYDWIDATGGTAYPLDDDASSGLITLPQPFTYFGVGYTSLRINSNGYIYFGPNTYNVAHMVLPFEGRPNNDAMAFGEDLNPAGGTQGMIYALAVGNLFVIQWDEVEHWASGFPETFEIILNLDTGEITYQYHTLSWPDFSTVGLENDLGSVGKMYSYANSANLTNGRAVRYTPQTGNAVNYGCTDQVADLVLIMTDSPDPVAPGDPVTYTLTIDNSGPDTAVSVNLVNTLPAGATFVSATASQGSCQEQNGIVTCALGDLVDQAAAEVSIVITLDQLGMATNQATVYSASGDPDWATNSAAETTEVAEVPEDDYLIFLPVVLLP
jgi:uncharacterized repeat protein (TIGR01451 family)